MQTESTTTADFGNTFKLGYLGDPGVVSALVGAFAGEVHGWLVARASGELSQEDFLVLAKEGGLEFARIFSGQHPDYPPVIGWNSPDHGLANRLRVDLGQFWAGHHSKHDDDPYRVQHAWLGWYVFDCMKRGASDSTGVVYDVLLSTGLKALVRNLMGTDKRA